MTSVKPQGPLTVGTVTVRRKPAFTYQSPVQSTALSHPDKSLFTPQSATALPLSIESAPSRLLQMPELSQRSAVTHKSSRHHMTTTLLPLYHPLGTLALSLPDLDPTAFGLPAPVAVFDPTRRSSNRQRRPVAKVRDADEAATPQAPSFIAVTPAPDTEVREKSSPRRRRGGGPGAKRRRREPEDGDATYPAKRARNSRTAGVTSGLSGVRTLSRDEGSPTLSNGQSRASPELGGEKKPERRSTRSRGAIVRRDSTTSEDTVTSASRSVSATNTGVPPVASSGETGVADEPVSDTLNAARTGVESEKVNVDDMGIVEQQEN